MLRRVLAVVGLVLFLGAFALLAERVHHLGRVEVAAPSGTGSADAETADGADVEPGP